MFAGCAQPASVPSPEPTPTPTPAEEAAPPTEEATPPPEEEEAAPPEVTPPEEESATPILTHGTNRWRLKATTFGEQEIETGSGYSGQVFAPAAFGSWARSGIIFSILSNSCLVAVATVQRICGLTLVYMKPFGCRISSWGITGSSQT
jgi:hypothetical protein